MKRKRVTDISEQLAEYGGKVKIPRQTRKSMVFDDLCNFFDGIYVGSRFMGFIIPSESTKKLDMMIRKITGIKNINVDDFLSTDWGTDNKKVTNHRILRIVLNLDLYNEHFALTQKYDKTYGADVETIKNNLQKNSKTEKDLFRGIVQGNAFNVILPLYLNEIITEPWEWGPEVMTSVNNYFKHGDRRFVDMGNKERCYELLNGPLFELGLVRKCSSFQHPPIPSNSTNRNTKIKMKRDVYLPTMTFHDIGKYDNEGLPSTINNNNVKFHSLENYTTLDKSSTIVITTNNCIVFDNEFNVMSINDFKTLPKHIKSVVLVFKNHGEKKTYDMLDHPLIPGLKRTSSVFRYIIPSNRIDTTICYTTIKSFNQ